VSTEARAGWQGAGLDPPWFDAIRDVAAPLGDGWPAVERIDAALAGRAGVRFVAADRPRPRRRSRRPIDVESLYEVRIAARREVPTRPDSAHDLLNALAWAAFPRAKWALSRRLAEEQRERLAGTPVAWRLPGTRSRAHDRLALLDEGGILVAGCRALVFGHALLEHALRGEIDVGGAVIALEVDPDGATSELRARLDAALAGALTPGGVIEEPAAWPRRSLRELVG
jgi:hypothetical protein